MQSLRLSVSSKLKIFVYKTFSSFVVEELNIFGVFKVRIFVGTSIKYVLKVSL